MKKLVKTTPDGFKDLLFGACAARRDIERKLMEIFRLCGYHEIITPTLEYYDVFSFDTSYIPMHEMYKLTDLSGRLLVLRPDVTVPLARVVATHLKDAVPPFKLCYNLDVFRITPNMSGQRDEIAQCGAELIGADGLKADLEIITTAVSALRSFCGEGFRFEIGHVGFYNSLINQLPLSHEQREELNELMRTKNYAPLNDLLNPYKHLRAAKGLMRLPRMFGGAEVLAEAGEYASDSAAKETIAYLETLYKYLLKFGLLENVMIDLGEGHGSAYYTGIVFRGYREGLNLPVLSGGRYDLLLKEFGRDMPSIGFSIYLNEAARNINGRKSAANKEYLIHAQNGYERKAFGYAQELREKGEICAVSVFDDIEQTAVFAERTGAFVISVGEEITPLAKEDANGTV